MDNDLFLSDLSEILQREDALSGNEKIEDIGEWDSLAVLGILSLLEDNFNLEMSAEELGEFESIQELTDLIKKTLKSR